MDTHYRLDAGSLLEGRIERAPDGRPETPLSRPEALTWINDKHPRVCSLARDRGIRKRETGQPMLSVSALPLIAYSAGGFVIILVALNRKTSPKMRWMLPAILGACYFAFSAVALTGDGLQQIWANHMTNLAGNQVWIDVVIAVTIAVYLIAPRARAVGMPLLPWAIGVVATASVALLPMLARVLWLEHKVRPSAA